MSRLASLLPAVVFALTLSVPSAVGQTVSEAARLAPTASDWREASTLALARLELADAAEEAVGSLHNDWVRVAARSGDCAGPGASLAARSQVFGGAWRDAVEASRMAVRDAVPMLESPTLIPLVAAEDRQLAVSLQERLTHHERALAEASTWHRQNLARTVARCGSELQPAPGFPRDRVRAAGEDGREAVLVAVPEHRVLCVDGSSVGFGSVFSVPAYARVCAAAGTECSCSGQRADPAAVLGTTTTP